MDKPINFHWMWRRHWTEDRQGILDMAIELDEANVKSVLLPYGPLGLDFSMFLPEVLEKTNQMILTLALPAYGVSPDYAAKVAYTLNMFGPNRLGINLVAGRWGDEGGSHSEKVVMDHYMLPAELIDTLDKRVAITATWMEKFVDLMNSHPYKTHLAVVGTSDVTIDTANKYTEYIYIDDNILHTYQFVKIRNAKPILILDPLINEDPEDIDNVKYDINAAPRRQHHHVKGTHDEVVTQIKELSKNFNIYDFMIHTDQADISKLLKLVKEFK